MSDAPPKAGDDTRPCTVCRMPVSNLAVKCHHCGAQVGRPKEASRVVTIEELGGETVEHYAPSSNVMDALESFRADESTTSAMAPKKTTRFGKKSKAEEPAPKNNDGLPELDEKSQALASIAMPRSMSPAKKTGIDIGEYLKYVGIAVVLLLVGGGAYVYLPGMVGGGEEIDEYVSRVPMLRQSNASNLQILEAAVEAADRQPTPEHEADLEKAREDIAAEIDELLQTEEMTSTVLRSAASLASKAAVASPSEILQDLKADVDQDIRAYNTLLTAVDFAAKEATFKLAGESHTVKRGELFLDRFMLDNIKTDRVRLIDTLRADRRIEVKINSQFL